MYLDYKKQFMDRFRPIELNIPNDVKEYCKSVSELLMKERTYNTMYGGGDFVYRGCLVQEMYHKWLESLHWGHEYMAPYTREGMPKEEWDIKIAGETFDTKCRGFWSEEYPYNIEHLFSQLEYYEKDIRKYDYYLFGVTDKEREKVYLLGGLSFNDLWNALYEPEEYWDKKRTKPREYKFPTYGYIKSRDLKPLKEIIFRV